MRISAVRGVLSAVALLAVLAAVSGCGDGGDESTHALGQTQPSADATPTTTDPAPAQDPDGQTGDGSNPKEGNGRPKESQKPQGLPVFDSSSLPNEGTGEPAPGVPVPPRADTSIQTYGVEGSGEERSEAATTVKRYMDALVSERWGQACSLLAGATLVRIEELLERAPPSERNGGCPKLIAGFIGRIPESTLRELSDVHVLSLRTEGDRGFLIYDDGTGRASEAPLELEDDGWRMRAIIAKELIVQP